VTQTEKSESAARWSRYPEQLFWAILIGLLSGSACVALRKFFLLLQWLFTGHAGLLSVAAADLPLWRRAITPVLGAAAATLIIWYSRRIARAEKSRDYVEAVRFADGQIPLKPTLWRTLSSAFSVATGAAIGREGSMIQFAATVTSSFGERLRISAMPLSRQVACGVAAAVATVYQAPIAGAFFAAEIVLGEIAISETPLLLISAFTGVLAGYPFLEHGPLFQIPGNIGLGFAHLLPALLMALTIGTLGPVYYWLIHSMSAAKKLPLALLWGGALVGALSLSRTEVWGNGDAALLHIMQTAPALKATLFILALRLCATTFCVGTGTIGGVFTPTLFAGSAVGLFFGYLLHVPGPLLFAVLGMSCLLAAVTHAPWMSMFITVELTGQWSLLPLLLLCTVVAWQVARHLSPHALYALATPEPATTPSSAGADVSNTRLKAVLQHTPAAE
jgi:chloride channel protein, CIC family